MKTLKLATACLMTAALIVPAVGHTEDTDKDRTSPKAFIKDTVITAKIKSEFARDKLVSARHIRVDTENKGVVQLGGTAKSQEEVDKAVALAYGVKGVVAVENHIRVSDDR